MKLLLNVNPIQYVSSTFRTSSLTPRFSVWVLCLGSLSGFSVWSGRYVLQAAKHMEPQMKQAIQNIPKSVRNNH